MLVLTRKQGQVIHIGEIATITVVKISGTGKVQLGIEAPNEVVIRRGEIPPQGASVPKHEGKSDVPG